MRVSAYWLLYSPANFVSSLKLRPCAATLKLRGPLTLKTRLVVAQAESGSLPDIFTGIRLAWGISLIVIIAAEMVGASAGIGYMVLEAQQTFRTERLFACIIVIGLLGLLTDVGFRGLRRAFLPWNRQTEG